MATVLLHFSISLDGFVAGPGVSVAQPMGLGGARLHDWLFPERAQRSGEIAPSAVDAGVERELHATVGAVVLGKRTFDVGLPHWGGTPFPAPSFVLSHQPRASLAMANGTFTFISEGVERAVDQAREAAGHKTVVVMGADTARQALKAGLVDEIQLQLVPVFLGDGTRLFDDLGANLIALTRTRLLESPLVTHLRFRVTPSARG
jgi:dihydrofolate reductase